VSRQSRSTADGPGRLLVAVYAVFAVSASARSLVQISTEFSAAPLAYTLSAVAALVYVAATVALALNSRTLAWVAVLVELVGVVGIGALSVLQPDDFADATVWSRFGQGYGYVPLVLPLIGLVWLARTRGVD
jgi:hypothetical protein